MTPRSVALAALLSTLAPAPSFALAFSNVGDADATDPNKRCKLEKGPKIVSAPVAACFRRIIKSRAADLSDDKIALTPVSADEASYCFCARLIGLKDWSEHFDKIAWKSKKISKGATKDMEDWGKYYAHFAGHVYCGNLGAQAPDVEAMNKRRQTYVDVLATYIRQPVDKPLLGGAPSHTREDALKALADVAQYVEKPCDDLKEEGPLLRSKLADAIQTGAAADRK